VPLKIPPEQFKGNHVDKFARKLYIYQNGTKKNEFEAEFGKN
jgi:hypothetical protein